MTFSGDRFESLSSWSKIRSYLLLSAIIIGFTLLIMFDVSRGYALVALALLTIIMLHEAGHFLAAKWAKMKATEFFVGFGPRIWSFKKGETEYGIKAIPLGGYVKIIGMTNLEEVEKEDEDKTYRQGKTYKKLVVILAGVMVNLLLGFGLIYLSFVGRGVPVDTKTSRAVIEVSNPNSPSGQAGLTKGDEIVRIDDTIIKSFDELVVKIQTYEIGEAIKVGYLRDGNLKNVTIELGARPDERGKPSNIPYMGVNRELSYERMGYLEAVPESGKAIHRVVDRTIGIFTDRFSTSGISEYSEIVINGEHEREDRPSSVAGIVDTGGNLVNQDIWYLIDVIALVNIVLALFNVLPLLPLDGGHAVVAIYEGIASRIMRRKVVADFRKLVPLASVVIGLFAVLALSSFWLDFLQIAS